MVVLSGRNKGAAARGSEIPNSLSEDSCSRSLGPRTWCGELRLKKQRPLEYKLKLPARLPDGSACSPQQSSGRRYVLSSWSFYNRILHIKQFIDNMGPVLMVLMAIKALSYSAPGKAES